MHRHTGALTHPRTARPRLAFVVQRYGPEVNGGAEMQCRQLAERLSHHFPVEVLTTCAEDHYTWRNVYAPGSELINGVAVHRFATDRERDMATFDAFTRRIRSGPRSLRDEARWMELQGPLSSGLLAHLDHARSDYDLLVFFTYLYASTYFGLQIAPEKSVLLANAHDDPWIRFGIFRSLFNLPRAFVFNSPEEQKLIHRLFANEHIPGRVLGSGIDVQRLDAVAREHPWPFADDGRIRPGEPYIVYVGRIDPSKGCDLLFEHFLRYKADRKSALKLVLIGRATMPTPDHPDVIPLGFLRDAPYAWMAHARALVLPSVMESLSLVVLESLGLGIPILVNGHCDVLRGHCRRSNGGLYYYGYDEFAAALDLLLAREALRRQLGQCGMAYIRRHYAWDVVEKRYVDWLTWVAEPQRDLGAPDATPACSKN